MEATKRPWKIHEDKNSQRRDRRVTIEYSDGELRSVIAWMYDAHLCAEHGTLDENARLIVTAVNHHQELVDALIAITFAAKTEKLEKNSVAWKNLLEDCIALLAKIKEG